MTEPAQASVSPGKRRLLYTVTVIVTAAVTFGLAALLMNINDRKQEAEHHYFPRVPLDEDTIDAATWGKNFPSQYQDYLKTVDVQQTKHGGSEAFSKLEQDPRLVRMYKGYAFSVDFREERGHAHMLSDQDITDRTTKFKQPGACLHCHASNLLAFKKLGDGDVMKGFEKMCPMPLSEARKLVQHPITCLDCHDPKTLELRVTRPGFLNGIQRLAESSDPVPHMPSVMSWRKGDRGKPYDVNALATRQEMRSFVCGQCHVEYYFKGEGKLLTYPWHEGLKVEQIEKYYDKQTYHDWLHAETETKVLKAQHPEFELWSQGTHARAGVSCADCHMPFRREGAVKISDHHVRSPLLNISRACQTCHRVEEKELLARAEGIQDRTQALAGRAEDALMQMMDALKAARDGGVGKEKLEPAMQLHRKAQWRLDFVLSENSWGFHAPQESARILGEAIDYARQAQIKAIEAGK